jgi:hypothetical protein
VHPLTNQPICTSYARFIVTEALHNNDLDAASALEKRFRFKRTLVLRAEHVIVHALRQRVPALVDLASVFDEDAVAKLCGKAKRLGSLRPDFLAVNQATRIGIHIEIDESPDHEDDNERLSIIHRSLNMEDRVFVIRIHAHLQDELRMCTRKTRRDGVVFYQMNDRGNIVVDEVVRWVDVVVGFMKEGLVPNEVDRPWKVVFAK